MTNEEQNSDSKGSFQLIEILKKEVHLMREILSEYKVEETLLNQGNHQGLDLVGQNKSKLKRRISTLRRKKKALKTEAHFEDCDLKVLEEQIQALNAEIIDKIALVKNLKVMTPKLEPKKQKQVKIATEEDLQPEL